MTLLLYFILKLLHTKAFSHYYVNFRCSDSPFDNMRAPLHLAFDEFDFCSPWQILGAT